MSEMALNKQFWDNGLKCIHVYVGILIAPLILIAAFTGVLYGLTPQIERTLYKNFLIAHHQPNAKPQALSVQIQRAQDVLPKTAHIMAVRPAENTNATTRVLYMDDEHAKKMMAVFINPYTLNAQGQLAVYGTSGVLPMRTFLDQLHRELLLGHYGRIYSELAASWLGVLALTGLIQWFRKRNQQLVIQRSSSTKKHILIGLIFLPALLFFSITGLTWSNWAGGNIAQFRHWFNGDTPTLQTNLSHQSQANEQDPHAEHHAATMHLKGPMANLNLQNFDEILLIARENGLVAHRLQIKPSDQINRAWTVQEMNHQWPIQVDAIAVDMNTKQVVDKLEFKDFPLSARLTRWGVDLHIGVLFGWINQIALVLSGLAICLAILLIYIPWLIYSKPKTILLQFSQHVRLWWQSGTNIQRVSTLSIIGLLYFVIPVWFWSVMVFIAITGLVTLYEQYKAKLN
ncbi:PepSY-associated TM helix domain-containing protein [Acinetobacter apis]|uniref:Uncharacterized iron-regulated membrane protein n=2 Tax=Acinetobacter apis TaxID=1229165 RepID=A0A217EE46_9GAMM|nr:Uncharacterized iron-regulated membrane protein [Acinetobacter apis]